MIKKILLCLMMILFITGCGKKVNQDYKDEDLQEVVLDASAITIYNTDFTLHDKDGNIYIVDCAYLDQIIANHFDSECSIDYIVKYYEKDEVRHIVKFQYKIGERIYQPAEYDEMVLTIDKACSAIKPEIKPDEEANFIGIVDKIDNYQEVIKVPDTPSEDPDKKPVINTGVR